MNCLSERQEISRGMVEDKIRMQSRATEKYCEQIFEEMKELEEKKSEEALTLVQKKNDLWRYQNERDEARRLQRSGSSRRMTNQADSQDLCLLPVMQVIDGGSRHTNKSGVSEKDSGRASGDE